VEALARPRSRGQASTEDAREFLKPLVGHESIDTEPAAYSLRQVTDGRYVKMELEALRPVDITLHILKVHRTNRDQEHPDVGYQESPFFMEQGALCQK
jgi:hypothetical protein